MHVIHGAAMCGCVEAIIDLIEKHGVNPRCKGHVSTVAILFVITLGHVTCICNVVNNAYIRMYIYVSVHICNRFMTRTYVCTTTIPFLP